MRPSDLYLYIGNPYIVKKTSLYWDVTQNPEACICSFHLSSFSSATEIDIVMNNSTSTVKMIATDITISGVSNSSASDEVAAIPWGQIALYLIVSIVIFVGNSLVIAAVLRYEFLQTPTNAFVVAIAGLDLFMGLAGMFKIGQLINVYEGYYTCMARLGLAVVHAVATGNLLAGTIKSPFISVLSQSLTGRNMIYCVLSFCNKYSPKCSPRDTPKLVRHSEIWSVIWRSKFGRCSALITALLYDILYHIWPRWTVLDCIMVVGAVMVMAVVLTVMKLLFFVVVMIMVMVMTVSYTDGSQWHHTWWRWPWLRWRWWLWQWRWWW